MRILFLLSRIEKSGVALHTADLIRGLREAGHTVLLVSGGNADPDSPYLKELEDEMRDSVEVFKVFRTPKGSFPARVLAGIFATLQVWYWLLTLRYDILHVQSPYLTFLPWLIGKKYLSTVHNVQLVRNLKYKPPTRLIAISEESREYALAHLGASPDRIDVVCHGISDRYAEPASKIKTREIIKKYDLGEGALRIGFVGRITRDKGLDILIEAVLRLPASMRKSVQLIFLGDYYSEEDRQWLEDILREVGDRIEIHILPFQDPKPVYDIFDIFVLPSKSEAFGLVCVEAMMSGCCTVRTDTNGARDQIRHGVDGFIYPREDPDALMEILKELIHNPDRRKDVSRKGRERAMQKFTLQSMTENTLGVYKKLL